MGRSLPNSGWNPQPAGSLRRARPLSAGCVERKQEQRRILPALHAANIQQSGSSVVVSGHPDALRRREQAAAR